MGKLTDAVRQNNLQAVQKLLKDQWFSSSDYLNKPLINEEKDNLGNNALYIAAYYGYVSIVDCLVKAGAKVDQPNNNGITPLLIAALNGHVEALQVLLQAGAAVNLAGKEGITPLHFAALKGHTEVLQVLLKAGAKVDLAANEGSTPLCTAAQEGHTEALQVLLKAGAAVNSAMNDGATPLHFAALKGHTEVLQVLLQAGAKVDLAMNNGETSLYTAAWAGKANIVQMLLRAGAQIESGLQSDSSEFYDKAKKGDKNVIEILLKGGASVDRSPQIGATPLWIAAENGHIDVVNVLLAHSANIHVKTVQGQSPLDAARNAGYTQVIDILENHLATHFPQEISSTLKALTATTTITTSTTTTTASTLLTGSVYVNNLDSKAPKALMFSSQKSAPIQTTPVAANSSAQVVPIKQPPKVDAKDFNTFFLKLVAEGEQDQVETLLQKDKDFALASSDITDLSNRTFKNITGFQYAVWALDWNMWVMIRKYLPDEEARKQIESMETGSWVTQHGKSASWQNLLDALQKQIDLLKQFKRDEAETQWQKQVGGAQRLLPVHVVNEYCHPTRPFEPCPNFTKPALPRSRKMEGDEEGEWFTAVYNGGKLGDKFACYRDGSDAACCRRASDFAGARAPMRRLWLAADHIACTVLLVTREQQRDHLFAELVSKNSQAARNVFG